MERDERLREMLQAKRRELFAELERHVGTRFGDDQASRIDSAIEIGDRATTLHGQDVDLTVLDLKRARLHEIEQALARLDLGTYGTCDECGEAIDEERLAILPFALTCVDCKRRLEAEKRPFEEPGSGFRSGFGDVRDDDDREDE
ncbi:MAG: TraR/DksA family transcriptional regulator [Candidatus Binatia bacterium]